MRSTSETTPNSVKNFKFTSIIQILEERASVSDGSAAIHFFHDDAGMIEEAHRDSWSWKELFDRARAVALQLALKHSVTPKSRVLVVYPMGLDFMAAFYGCLYAGVIPVPVPPPRRSDGLNRWLHIARDADIAGVLGSTDLIESLQPLVDGIAGGFCAAPQAADPSVPCAETPANLLPFLPSPADIAFLQYTSGSTSDAKGVMVTHGNMMANLRQISIGYEMSGADRMVSWLPHYHDMGLIGCILSPLHDGYCAAYMSPASFLRRPLRFLALASHFRATIFGGPNFSYDHCVRRSTPDTLAGLDLSSLRIAFNGAEAIRPSTLSRFAETFAPCGFSRSTYLCCYGMAEATLFITGIKPSEHPRVLSVRRDVLVMSGQAEAAEDIAEGRPERLDLAGSGRAVDGLALSIVDPVTGRPRPERQVGEVWVRGANIAAGYWRRPEQSTETFDLHLEGTRGWFRTGDLGFLLSDQLFITGRLKDMIVIRGENHYPQDIEMTASASHPALAEGQAGAVALEIDGEECLGLVCEVTREAFRRLDTDAVFTAIRGAVSRTHSLQIAAILLIRPGNLPRTPSGKVRRFACRQGLESNSLPTVGRWDAAPATDSAPLAVPPAGGGWREALYRMPAPRREGFVRQRLQLEIGKLSGLPAGQAPATDKGFFDLGLDSVAVSSFAAMLERETGLKLGQTVMFEHTTIASLAAHLCALLAEGEGIPATIAVADDPVPAATAPARQDGVSDAVAAELAALQSLLNAEQGRRTGSASPLRDGDSR